MPKKFSQGFIRLWPIPSNSKYKYSDFVDPVYETDKVPKDEMEHLSCRATHCVRFKVTDHVENDNLYNIFTLYSGQN